MHLDLLTVDLSTCQLVPIDKPHPPPIVNYKFNEIKASPKLALPKKNYIRLCWYFDDLK